MAKRPWDDYFRAFAKIDAKAGKKFDSEKPEWTTYVLSGEYRRYFQSKYANGSKINDNN